MLTTGGDVALAAIIFGTMSTAVVQLARMRYKHLAERHRPPLGAAEGDERLQRLEQAVDAIAVEVERMSESQRFVTKLLAERLPPGQVPPSAGPGR